MTSTRDWLGRLDKLRSGELSREERLRLENAFGHDPESHQEYTRINGELDELGRAEPPVHQEWRRQQIVQRVLELAQQQNARNALPWLGVRAMLVRGGRRAPALAFAGALLAVATTLVVFVWSTSRSTAPAASLAPLAAAPLTLKSGRVESGGRALVAGERIQPSKRLTVTAELAELTLSDASRLKATRHTKFEYVAEPADRLLLEHGQLSLLVAKRAPAAALMVQTPEAEVWVVGTQFVVERALHATTFSTTVSVSEGLVKVVAKVSGQTTLLHAGQKSTFAGTPATQAQRPLGSETGEKGRATDDARAQASNGQASAARRHTLTANIRQKLREGAVRTARELIHQAQRTQAASAAELAVLEAEADLAEHRYDRATQRYLEIFEKYPKTPQAELSLFAAAQLTRGSRSIDLLQRYLARYPHGRFSREAQRLLDTLDTR